MYIAPSKTNQLIYFCDKHHQVCRLSNVKDSHKNVGIKSLACILQAYEVNKVSTKQPALLNWKGNLNHIVGAKYGDEIRP